MSLLCMCRFWVGENNERLSNPFVLCLNLVSCKVGTTETEERQIYRDIIHRQTETDIYMYRDRQRQREGET